MENKYEGTVPEDLRETEFKERAKVNDAVEALSKLKASLKDISLKTIEAQLAEPGLSAEAIEHLEMLKRVKQGE